MYDDDNDNVELECLGGPMDGQTVSVRRDELSDAVSVAVDKETGQAHFYALRREDGEVEIGERNIMVYLGSDMRRLLDYLRKHNSPIADRVAAQIDAAMVQDEPFSHVELSTDDDDDDDDDDDTMTFDRFSKL